MPPASTPTAPVIQNPVLLPPPVYHVQRMPPRPAPPPSSVPRGRAQPGDQTPTQTHMQGKPQVQYYTSTHPYARAQAPTQRPAQMSSYSYAHNYATVPRGAHSQGAQVDQGHSSRYEPPPRSHSLPQQQQMVKGQMMGQGARTRDLTKSAVVATPARTGDTSNPIVVPALEPQIRANPNRTSASQRMAMPAAARPYAARNSRSNYRLPLRLSLYVDTPTRTEFYAREVGVDVEKEQVQEPGSGRTNFFRGGEASEKTAAPKYALADPPFCSSSSPSLLSSDTPSATLAPQSPCPLSSRARPRSGSRSRSRTTHLSRRPSQLTTQYMNMLLALDGIPRMHNILASFFAWVLLAGFVIFPATFAEIKENNGDDGNGESEGMVVAGIFNVDALLQNATLFAIGSTCSTIGALGMLYLFLRWRRNYVWLVNRIFMPGLLNSLTGITTTLVSVLAVHGGDWTLSSLVTVIVTASSAIIFGTLTTYYSAIKLRAVKRRHDRTVGRESAGRYGEGVLGRVKRKMEEIQPEAGMV